MKKRVQIFCQIEYGATDGWVHNGIPLMNSISFQHLKKIKQGKEGKGKKFIMKHIINELRDSAKVFRCFLSKYHIVIVNLNFKNFEVIKFPDSWFTNLTRRFFPKPHF